MDFLIRICLPLTFLLNWIADEVQKLNLQNKDVVGILKIIGLVFLLTLVIMFVIISNIRVEKGPEDEKGQTKLTLYFRRKND